MQQKMYEIGDSYSPFRTAQNRFCLGNPIKIHSLRSTEGKSQGF